MRFSQVSDWSGSGFHIHPNGTGTWIALLFGRKFWVIYPLNKIPDIPIMMDSILGFIIFSRKCLKRRVILSLQYAISATREK